MMTSSQNQQVINDGHINFIDGFALFVASLVGFKFIFALMYTLKWNCRQWTRPYYRKGKFDIAEEFKRLRKDRNGAYSTDEDDDDDEEKIFNAKETGGSVNMIFEKKADGSISYKENKDIDDSDNDDEEFADAVEEEIEDRQQQSMRVSQQRFSRLYNNGSRPSATEGTIMKKLDETNTTVMHNMTNNTHNQSKMHGTSTVMMHAGNANGLMDTNNNPVNN